MQRLPGDSRVTPGSRETWQLCCILTWMWLLGGWIFWLKTGLSLLGWCRISSLETCYVVVFYVGAHGYPKCPLGGILSVRKNPEWWHGLQNVNRGYTDIMVCKSWVKLPVWVKHPFKLICESCLLSWEQMLKSRQRFYVPHYIQKVASSVEWILSSPSSFSSLPPLLLSSLLHF